MTARRIGRTPRAMPRRHRRAALVALLGLALGAEASLALELSLVSRPDDPADTNGRTGWQPDMDASGATIVFVSRSAELDDERYQETQTVPPTGLWSGAAQIFAYDVASGRQTLISDEMPPGGIAIGGDFDSDGPAISASGRYIAYRSQALNIVTGGPGYCSGCWEVFRYDRDVGTTTRRTFLSSATTAEVDVADTGTVVFRTAADQPALGDTNGVDDIYAVTWSGMLRRMSSPQSIFGGAAGASAAPAISGDGRWVVFDSAASNLVFGDSNAARDVFIRDLQSNLLLRLSDAPGVDQTGADSYDADVSHDGRYVAFVSEATNLVAGQASSGIQAFLLDRTTGVMKRISVTSAALRYDTPQAPRIAANGAWVLFEGRMGPGSRALFRYETSTGALELVDVYAHLGAYAVPRAHAIDDGGRRIAFDNDVALPVPRSTVGSPEVYRAELEPGSIAFSAATQRVSEAGNAIIALTRSGGSDGAVSVHVRHERSDAAALALPQWDFESYLSLGGYDVSWAAGDATPQEIFVPIVDDQDDEADETFRLRIGTPTAGAALGPDDTIEVTIADDDF